MTWPGTPPACGNGPSPGRRTAHAAMTRHAAMDTLSRTLIQAAARGYAAPVALAGGVAGPFYLRTPPAHAAGCGSTVIQRYPREGNP